MYLFFAQKERVKNITGGIIRESPCPHAQMGSIAQNFYSNLE